MNPKVGNTEFDTHQKRWHGKVFILEGLPVERNHSVGHQIPKLPIKRERDKQEANEVGKKGGDKNVDNENPGGQWDVLKDDPVVVKPLLSFG